MPKCLTRCLGKMALENSRHIQGIQQQRKHPCSHVAFIDLEKAFNCVWRDSLLVKLQIYGIRGRLWKWIEGFKKSQVPFEGLVWANFLYNCWSSQGSVISVVLFIFFLQDIFKEISANGVKYADDGTIWVTGNDIKDLLRAVEEDFEEDPFYLDYLEVTTAVVVPRGVGKTSPRSSI